MTTSGLEADALWPLLVEIVLRLTLAEGSALYVRDEAGVLQFRAMAGLTTWPALGDLFRRLASESASCCVVEALLAPLTTGWPLRYRIRTGGNCARTSRSSGCGVWSGSSSRCSRVKATPM